MEKAGKTVLNQEEDENSPRAGDQQGVNCTSEWIRRTGTPGWRDGDGSRGRRELPQSRGSIGSG